MERYNGVELDPEGAFVYYDDAQRALDAERARVKELEGAASTPINELLAELISCAGVFDVSTDYEGDRKALETATQAVLDHVATLQAQLAEIEQILCIESGKTTVDKVRDLHHSFKQVWNSYQSAVNELFDTQAQLRQMEGAKPDVGRLAVWEGIYENFYAVDSIVTRDAFSQLLAFYKAATLAAQDAGKEVSSA